MPLRGVRTFNQNGDLYMSSLSMRGRFFNDEGVVSNDTPLPLNGFNNVRSIWTPIEPFTYSLGANPNTSFGFRMNVPGDINVFPQLNEQNIYFQPRKFSLPGLGGYDEFFNINPRPVFYHSFGRPPAPIPNDYGFRARGQLINEVSIDSTNRSFYIHPDASGSFLRTGTTISFQSTLGPTTPETFNQPTQPNILFEREFDTPPLVFITNTTGPISLNFMARNAAGKYVGMSVAAEASIDSVGTLYTAAIIPNTYTFEYFLVAPEEPIFESKSNYGLQVFGQSGNKVFDSSFFEPSFLSLNAQKRTMSFRQNPFTYTFEVTGFSIPFNYGVCLNNMNVGIGATFYTAIALPDTVFAPLNFTARFLSVNKSQGTGQIKGGATNSILIRHSSQFFLEVPYVYEWNRGTTPNIELLFATFQHQF